MPPFRQELEGGPVASRPQPSASPCLVPGEICLRPADAGPACCTAPRAPSSSSLWRLPTSFRRLVVPACAPTMLRLGARKVTDPELRLLHRISHCLGWEVTASVPRETQGFASSWYPLTWENLPLTAHKHGKRRPPDTTATSRNTKGLEKVPSFRRVPVPGLASALRPAEGRRNSVINTRGGKARVDPSSHPTRKLRGACRALSYGAASQKLLQPSAPERDPAWGMCAYGPT